MPLAASGLRRLSVIKLYRNSTSPFGYTAAVTAGLAEFPSPRSNHLPASLSPQEVVNERNEIALEAQRRSLAQVEFILA
jgi:hypothetical protein